MSESLYAAVCLDVVESHALPVGDPEVEARVAALLTAASALQELAVSRREANRELDISDISMLAVMHRRASELAA